MILPLYFSHSLLNQGQGASLGQKATSLLIFIQAKPEVVNFHYSEINKIQAK